MARTFRDRMNSLPPERCARIEAETARMMARIEAQDAERAIIRETAQMVHHAFRQGFITEYRVQPSWSPVPITIRRTLDVLKLRRPQQQHRAA